MRSRNAVLLAALWAAVCTMAAAGSAYDEATAIGKADAVDPQHRAWYLQIMRPAFSQVFQALLNQCVPTVPAEDLQGFGLVLVVGSEGAAKRFFWKTPNAFSRCLEAGMREATFPPAPKEEFYFGLEGPAS